MNRGRKNRNRKARVTANADRYALYLKYLQWAKTAPRGTPIWPLHDDRWLPA